MNPSINQLRRGELDSRIATAIGYLASVHLSSLEQPLGVRSVGGSCSCQHRSGLRRVQVKVYIKSLAFRRAGRRAFSG
jgi:hypothetical protein